ncbi:MAG: fasciclin domain-containing protein [Opitutales bacterium]|nr:fasciclin domain-containing protein [Opitutales bacterium]
MKKLTSLLVMSSLLTGSAFAYESGSSKEIPEESSPNIFEAAAANEDFSTLVAALEAAGLEGTLSGEGPFTVFVPSNEAFEALPEGTVDFLLQEENRDMLTSILTYHVVPGKIMASDVETGAVTTVNGADLTLVVSDEGVNVGAAMIVDTDIEASNGVIHVIDAVILPPEE